MSTLTQAAFKDYLSFEYRIAWHEDEEKERHVLLIPEGTALYRIIYDSKEALNKTVLDSLELNHPNP